MEESVHTIDDYYDGPIKGIADFEGRPHYYECEFDEAQGEHGTVFRLTPITDVIFALAMEKWEIWCRWRNAFDNRKATIETHPALPNERPRYEELKRIIDEHLASNRIRSIRVRGSFMFGAPMTMLAMDTVKVEWVRLEGFAVERSK